MKSLMLNLFFIFATILTLLSCSGGSENTTSTATKEIWGGVYTRINPNEAGSIILHLQRDGETTTGRYETTAGGEGFVTGIMTEEVITLTLTQSTAANCPGSFSINGQFLIADKDIAATFEGADCTGVYSGGQARMLVFQPEPDGLDFTGNYYGKNFSDLYFLSMSTQNSVNYTGSVAFMFVDFFYENITVITADANGSLGNDGSNSLMLMDLTNIASDSVVNYVSGSADVLDMYQDSNSLNRLRVSWDLRYEGGGGVGTGGTNMLQIK